MEVGVQRGGAVECRYGPCEVGDLEVRMKRSLAALGRKEIESIVEEEGRIEVCAKYSSASEAILQASASLARVSA